MSTQNVGNVRVYAANTKKNKHDFNHRVDTTCGLGDVFPVVNLELAAGECPNTKIEALAWLAPLVNPVYGQLKYHNWHYFVKATDLSRNFAQLLSQKRVQRTTKFVPTQTPWCTHGQLSALALCDSHCTVYYGACPSSEWSKVKDNMQLSLDRVNENLAPGDTMPPWLQILLDEGIIEPREEERVFDGFNGYSLNLVKLIPHFVAGSEEGKRFSIPLNNSFLSHFGRTVKTTLSGDVDYFNFFGIDQSPVSLKTADYVIEFSYNDNGYIWYMALAFRFSDFGKRIKRLIESSGYRMDISSKTPRTLFPLFALYKAYYNVFGLLEYQNWEDTPAAKLLYYYDDSNITYYGADMMNFGTGTHDNVIAPTFPLFLKDLSFMFSTDSVNFTSAHTRQFAVADNMPSSLFTQYEEIDGESGGLHISNGFQDRDSDGNPLPAGDTTLSSYPNNHAFINAIKHGQLDANILKKLYLITNRDTIIGQRIEEALRMQGLGDWVDSQKVSFIGHSVIDVDFSTVTSLCDTYSEATGEGLQLGDRSGKGSAYGKTKTFKYKADEFGYYIVLGCMVPEAPYCQQNDERTSHIAKMDFYHREFDGVGCQASRKGDICGELMWVKNDDRNDPPLDKNFGFLPTYSSQKIMQSKICGDFSLRSRRDVYLSRNIMKFIDLNSHTITKISDNGTTETFRAVCTGLAKDLPVAGTVWRYTCRYPWLGHLYRIFSAVGDYFDKFTREYYEGENPMVDFRKFYEFMRVTFDNFSVQHEITMKVQSPKLQLGDSYETTDDGNDGKTNANLSHA